MDMTSLKRYFHNSSEMLEDENGDYVLFEDIADFEAELMEQSRLLGMGSEREARLMAMNEELRKQLTKALKEIVILKVRLSPPRFICIPEEFRGRGYGRSGYEAGYEHGHRGEAYDNAYSAPRFKRAYRIGYAAGDADAKNAVDRALNSINPLNPDAKTTLALACQLVHEAHK